jgi:hypothetical protein
MKKIIIATMLVACMLFTLGCSSSGNPKFYSLRIKEEVEDFNLSNNLEDYNLSTEDIPKGTDPLTEKQGEMLDARAAVEKHFKNRTDIGEYELHHTGNEVHFWAVTKNGEELAEDVAEKIKTEVAKLGNNIKNVFYHPDRTKLRSTKTGE